MIGVEESVEKENKNQLLRTTPGLIDPQSHTGKSIIVFNSSIITLFIPLFLLTFQPTSSLPTTLTEAVRSCRYSRGGGVMVPPGREIVRGGGGEASW